MTGSAGTDAFYDGWAANGIENPRSAVSRHFERAFASGARVLDVGCGKGRDVVALLDMGFDGHGVEPHAAMRAQALARDPRLGARVAAAALPALGQPFGGGFDGVACSAVLMHVSHAELAPALDALVAVLRPAARMLLALPEMPGEWLVDDVDRDGRAFFNHAPEHVAALLARHGFALVSVDEIPVPSTEPRWRVLLFSRQGPFRR